MKHKHRLVKPMNKDKRLRTRQGRKEFCMLQLSGWVFKSRAYVRSNSSHLKPIQYNFRSPNRTLVLLGRLTITLGSFLLLPPPTPQGFWKWMSRWSAQLFSKCAPKYQLWHKTLRNEPSHTYLVLIRHSLIGKISRVISLILYVI